MLTHWKEREKVYVQRTARIRRELGLVPAYAVATVGGAPTEAEPAVATDAAAPTTRRRRRRSRVTAPDVPEEISQEEFDELVADLDVDDGKPAPGGAAEPPPPEPPPTEPVRTSRISSTGGARPAPKKPKPAKPKRPRNRRHGRRR